jgi:catechol 2,3-dioxygenase-like lactoylglutathione lyase family enzyme
VSTAPFQVLEIDHVQVAAPEELIDDVLGFYRDCLGLEELDKPEGTRTLGGWFRAGAQQIHVTVDPHNPLPRPHFGMRIDNFDAIVARLRAAGRHIEQASPIPGRRRFYTRDPAGNRIEITSYQEEGV